jgi:hypothetical protein
MRSARTSIAVIATAAVALLAAACGGHPSAVSVQGNRALAFSRCMRSNGVSNFPDPDSSGVIPKVALQQLNVSSSRFQSAQSACQQLLPNGGNEPSLAQLQQERTQALRFSQCVRAHGIPNFPDPISSGRMRIPDPTTVGIDQGSPKFEAANQACAKFRPPYVPSNAEYEAWARTHG